MGLLSCVFGGRTGHPWNVGQTSWRGLGQRRAAAPQQELSVIDDPGTFWLKRQEKRSNEVALSSAASPSVAQSKGDLVKDSSDIQ